MDLQLVMLLLISAQIINCDVLVDPVLSKGYQGTAVIETNSPIAQKYSELNQNQFSDHAEQANYVRSNLEDFTNNYVFQIVQCLKNYNVTYFIPFSIPNFIVNEPSVPPPTNYTWNIAKIGADKVQKTCTNGTNTTIVGTIDTGVLATHVNLAGNFLGMDRNGWYDCIHTAKPEDNVGHGTHTMCLFVGLNFTGVAPGVRWITCRGCNTINCLECCLLKCVGWMICPSDIYGNNKMCNSTPKIVSNSWGSTQGNQTWLNSMIDLYDTCRIIPVFAVGNSGNATQGVRCRTAGSPGDLEKVIAVGASNSTSGVEGFSSCGPSNATGDIKPLVISPGSFIISCWNKNITAYAVVSGTSMSAPQVAGAIALAHSKGLPNNNATYVQVSNLVKYTCCRPVDIPPPINNTCGNLEGNANVTNVWGWGRLDVLGMFTKCQPTPNNTVCPSLTGTSCTDAPSPIVDYCGMIYPPNMTKIYKSNIK